MKQSTTTNRKRQAIVNRERRRAEISRGAAELFAERGYFETAVGDIAEHCEMSKATLYHYFSSKEEILYAMHESLATRILEAAEATAAVTDDPLEQIAEMCRTFFDVTHRDQAQVRAFFSFFGELKGEYRERIDARRQELSALLEAMFRCAVETGAIRPVEPRIAMLVFAGVFNWAPHWYRPGGAMRPDELADFVFHTFMDGLTPRPPALPGYRPARVAVSSNDQSS